MLSRTEWVWRHLLVKALTGSGERRHSLSSLATDLGLSKTTVHSALDRPRQIGAVKSGRTGVRVLDPERLLLLWAGHRDLSRDVVYETRAKASLEALEDALTRGFVLGGFTAYRLAVGRNTVADYDTVLAYGAAAEAARRLPPRRSGRIRVLILEPDPLLHSYGDYTPIPQTYVDIFNLPGWQAARFFVDMTRRLFAEEAA